MRSYGRYCLASRIPWMCFFLVSSSFYILDRVTTVPQKCTLHERTIGTIHSMKMQRNTVEAQANTKKKQMQNVSYFTMWFLSMNTIWRRSRRMPAAWKLVHFIFRLSCWNNVMNARGNKAKRCWRSRHSNEAHSCCCCISFLSLLSLRHRQPVHGENMCAHNNFYFSCLFPSTFSAFSSVDISSSRMESKSTKLIFENSLFLLSPISRHLN